ncbi:MAG: division plane positioning ATPase MipZ [Pseudomonadota bacterium]
MSTLPPTLPMPEPRPAGGGTHVIVVGNEKGGSGKSTTALHIMVGLMRDGRRVGAIDTDARQGTFSRFVERRRRTAEKTGADLPMPEIVPVLPSQAVSVAFAQEEERQSVAEAFETLGAACDAIVVDTPGSDTHLSRVVHARADTLVTPLNDSFVDLDVLATVDPETLEILQPSTYAETVWEQRKRRMIADRGSIDWIVMRNRLSALDARNKRDMGDLLARLAKRIGFRLLNGFGERVIFRELYLMGLTLMDLREGAIAGGLTMSHLAARQEVRSLLDAIDLEGHFGGKRSYLG